MANQNTVKSVEKWKCYKFTWKLDMPQVNQLVTNTISIGDEKNVVGRVGFKKGSYTSHQLYFFSQAFHTLGMYVKKVECSSTADSERLHLAKVCQNKHLQMFHGVIPTMTTGQQYYSNELRQYLQPVELYFQVYVTGLINTFQYQPVDYRLSPELWNSLSNSSLAYADVELVVGSQTQSAHQAILAARSPVFLKKFQDKSFKSKIIIDDLRWDEFQNFLYFIYTGKLKTACNLALKEAAEKYDVKTLLELCKAVEQVPVVEEICNLEMAHASYRLSDKPSSQEIEEKLPRQMFNYST